MGDTADFNIVGIRSDVLYTAKLGGSPRYIDLFNRLFECARSTLRASSWASFYYARSREGHWECLLILVTVVIAFKWFIRGVQPSRLYTSDPGHTYDYQSIHRLDLVKPQLVGH